jgi:hypothetical protein
MMVVDRWGSIRISTPQLSATREFLSSPILGHNVQIVAGRQCEVPGFIAGQYTWDLSWTKCHGGRFLC